jgi:Skp family chaperone for outer membrane proteins
VKLLCKLILGAALVAGAWLTQAHAADLKIGFIDADRINRESVPAERATKKLEKEFAPREQELRKLEQQIKTLQGQLEKDSLTMSESDRRSAKASSGARRANTSACSGSSGRISTCGATKNLRRCSSAQTK